MPRTHVKKQTTTAHTCFGIRALCSLGKPPAVTWLVSDGAGTTAEFTEAVLFLLAESHISGGGQEVKGRREVVPFEFVLAHCPPSFSPQAWCGLPPFPGRTYADLPPRERLQKQQPSLKWGLTIQPSSNKTLLLLCTPIRFRPQPPHCARTGAPPLDFRSCRNC